MDNVQKKFNIAIVHDYLRTFGGGERVLLELHKIFPKAKIFVATADYKRMGIFGKEFQKFKIETSWAQKIPIFVKKPIFYRFLLPAIWSTIDVGNVNIVISSSGSNIAKGIKIPDNVFHICYCHTPARYLYGFETETDYTKIPVFGLLIKFIFSYLRKYDLNTNKSVGIFLANSKNVKTRIKKFYSRDSLVVYPPCKIPSQYIKANDDGYYLVVSRLVKYKNISLIVRAFNELGYLLKIVGWGAEGNKLKSVAKNNVEFLGEIPDHRLDSLFKNCRALVTAASDEDFGIAPVETQGYGKPVIAYYSGGYKETVLQGKTGIFFKSLTVNSLIAAIKKFEKTKFNSRNIWLHSKKYSEIEFKKKIMKVINNIVKNSK